MTDKWKVAIIAVSLASCAHRTDSKPDMDIGPAVKIQPCSEYTGKDISSYAHVYCKNSDGAVVDIKTGSSK